MTRMEQGFLAGEVSEDELKEHYQNNFEAGLTGLPLPPIVQGTRWLVRGGIAARGTIATARQVGHAGEAAVRGAFDIGPATRIVVNGATRIPDGLTATVVSEVKNVRALSYSRQLRDYAAFARETGRQFDLYVRPNTQLSVPLQHAWRSGEINVKFIPGL